MFWRQNAGKVQTLKGHWVELGPDGIADIVGFLPAGRIVFVECKLAKGKQRESQEACQKAVEPSGAIYVVAREPEKAVADVHAHPACQLDVLREVSPSTVRRKFRLVIYNYGCLSRQYVK